MIAGLATHASLQEKDPARPFIYTDEGFVGVRRELTEAEAVVVGVYTEMYRIAFGALPAGLHYTEINGEVQAVYFALA